MSNQSQHGQNSFNHHARIPFAALAGAHIVRVSFSCVKAHIGKGDRVFAHALNQGTKARIMHIGGGGIPIHEAAIGIQDKAHLCANDPTPVRHALFTDLLFASFFSARVNQLNP